MTRWPFLRRALLGLVLAGLAAGFAAELTGHPTLARGLWALPTAIVAFVVAVDFVAGLRRGTFGVDVVALLAIIAALALRQHLAAIIIAAMVAGGSALEEFAEARARHELAALVTRAPRIAHRQHGPGISDVAVEDVRPGDLLLVKSGEIVPVDGALEEGFAVLDESALTGEPVPITRRQGEAVRSGVLNAGRGAFLLRTTSNAERSTYAAVVRLVRAAEQDRPPMVRLADRWALGFLALTLLVCGLAWGWSGDPIRALAVLVVATPCPLILAAPVALICGLSRAARRGVIVKGGSALERLARARTALFDKTGTLTTGIPNVTGVEALEGFDPNELLRCAASLEQASQHVVGAAIVAAARALDLPLTPPREVKETSGSGVAGKVDGRDVIVGSAGLLAAAGLAPPLEGAAARLARAAAAAAWVALDGQVAGALLLTDPIRPDAPRALRRLRSAGLRRLVMISGDRPTSVEEVGTLLGLDAVHPELSPAGKIALVQLERIGGPTLMVGDGINDAPALAAADIGVAMGARGAAAASEAADVVLMSDHLDRIAEAVAIARRARAIALQSIVAGMGLSALAMGFAAFGYLPPVAGALLQEAIDVAVILNALRALGGGARPIRPLEDREAVHRIVVEHEQLRKLLERMRRTAKQMDQPADLPIADLQAIDSDFATLLLPHQQAEERAIYPGLANRLGGQDPLGAMGTMHEEIARQARRFGALLQEVSRSTASFREIHELQRLLHVLAALIALHLSAEEQLLSHVENLPARP